MTHDDAEEFYSMLLRYRDGACTAAERAQIESNPTWLQEVAALDRLETTVQHLVRHPAASEARPSPDEVIAFVAGTLAAPRHAELTQLAQFDPLLQAEVALIRDLEPNPLLERGSPVPLPEVPSAVRTSGQPAPPANAQPAHATRWTWPLPVRWTRRLVWAGAVVLVLGWGLAQQVQIRHHQAQIAHLQAAAAQNSAVAKAAFGNPDAQERRLDPTAAAPGARGRVFISPSAPAVVLYVNQLPPLPPGQVYQLWLMQRGQWVSLDTFTVDHDGRAWRLIQPTVPLGAPQGITITVEPGGGSAQPTGPAYLGTQF